MGLISIVSVGALAIVAGPFASAARSSQSSDAAVVKMAQAVREAENDKAVVVNRVLNRVAGPVYARALLKAATEKDPKSGRARAREVLKGAAGGDAELIVEELTNDPSFCLRIRLTWTKLEGTPKSLVVGCE